jgi:phage gpG-like protein
MYKNFIHDVLKDIKVELTDEFDLNFERKAFFDQPWPETKWPNRKGSLMMRSGALRRSIRARLTNNELVFSSSVPYAKIQNEGGAIVITAKMKKFFWAMYYRLSGSLTYSIKSRDVSNTKRNKKFTIEAEYWKALALKKVGSRLYIKPRPFLGHHRQVDGLIRRVIDDNFKTAANEFKNNLKP